VRTLFWSTFNFVLACLAASLVIQSVALAQESRIAGPIDPAQTVVLRGNLNPKAQAKNDLGPVDPGFKLNYITIAFKPSTAQQADLDALLADQQDRSSPQYHHWLTPEQYADRFGLSTGDVATIRAWLESEGFTINYVARGRNWIAFSGSASQVGKAFNTQIHHYEVDGESHFAIASEPSIPAALDPVVLGFRGLDDFHLKPYRPRRRTYSKPDPSRPEYTAPDGGHALVPDDIATIYDITQLYKGSIDGSGQRVVIAGQSDINLADIAAFRAGFGLPSNVPQLLLIPGSSDPGSTSDQNEADLDIEWAGAVARNAQIIYVYSTDVDDSAGYAISENIAPVISFSFTSGCEQLFTSTTLSATRSTAQQANVEGITLLAASGDSGAAGCDAAFAALEATKGLAISAIAGIPEVTAVGGSQFNEGSGSYWSDTNSPTDASALSYIPEIAWNESLEPAPGFSGGLAASGGGLSVFYPQPSWQVGPGVTIVNARAVPDVALSAAGHDPYAVVSDGQATLDEGTSAATPVFAGMIALLNQYERANGQGNINANLYRLAQTNIFHDITAGSNIVPCEIGTPDCTTGSFGYSAGIGYDEVTGLGSIDAYNLVTEWNAATPESQVILSCNPDPVNQQPPDSNGFAWAFTLTLTEAAGVATSLTDFTVNGTSYPADIDSFFGGAVIPAHGVITASLGYKTLTVPVTVVFGISGVDAGGRQWSQQISVPFNGMQSTPPPAISLSPTQLQFAWTVGAAVPASQSVTVSTSGGGTFTWTASSNVSWLSLSSATGLLTIGVSPKGLAPGNYTGTVSVNAAGVANSPQTISVGLTVAAATPSVVVSSVVNGASFQPVIVPGSWATIQGTNLSSATGTWDVVNGTLPTTVNGVSVTVAGQPGYVNYVSAGQINFIVPDVTAGIQQLVVQNSVGTSAAFNVTVSTLGPAFFAWPSDQVVATRQDYSYAVANGTFPGTTTTPAKPGEVLILWGTGFGPTNPTASQGEVTPSNATYSTDTLPTVTINNVSAKVYGAALAPGFAGLYQVAIQVPTSLGNGNWPVVATIGGASSPSWMVLAVQQ
jgi:uncharacterized protein (TIGR03437 family)